MTGCLRPSKKNLCDSMVASKLHETIGNLFVIENASFDSKIAGKVQMPLYRRSLGGRQHRKICGGADINCKTLRMQIVGHAMPAAN